MQVKNLIKKINEAKTAYYNGTSIISDEEYDALIDQLTKLNPEHPLLKEVGAEPTTEWVKEKHLFPLGSLNKANNFEEICNWYEKYSNNIDIIVVEKLDGLSIGAQYDNGILTKAILRGNAIAGENIYNNFIKMIGVQKTLPGFSGVLRGEIIITNDLHQKHFQEYSNPRNAASGICRRLDGIGCEYLSVYFYQVLGKEFETETDQFRFLKKNNFLIPQYKAFSTPMEVWKYYEQYVNKIRDNLNYWIDGLVLSCNDMYHQKNVGAEVNYRPKAKIALKFPNQLVKTTITKISWNVGNTGRITPIAWFKPIKLLGSNIEKASVYNISYIKELKLGIGASVLVCKANEIIPRVERVISPGTTIDIPTQCPSCNGKIALVGENLQCVESETCPAQIIGRLQNWINTLNIMEWGNKLLHQLVEKNLAHNITDLYKLTIEQLSALDRMGDKSAEKCFNTLWGHNPIALNEFLGGLSIPMVGANTIKMLIDGGLNTLDKILSASFNDLVNIKGLGALKANYLFCGLKDNEKIINDLLKLGIIVSDEIPDTITNNISQKLINMSFCITGNTILKRDELKQIILSNGGNYKDNITKETTHLIVADLNKTSSKINKATKLNIIVMSEEEFLNNLK